MKILISKFVVLDKMQNKNRLLFHILFYNYMNE
nr:MAG TPA_asm: hypothetical protein [Caudoviricetes sp.]